MWFTPAAVILPRRFGRRLSVPRRPLPAEPPVFVLAPERRAEFRQAKVRTPAVAAFDGQTRALLLSAEQQALPVASFAYAEDAERFRQACKFSLAYRLVAPRAAGGRGSIVQEDDDDV